MIDRKFARLILLLLLLVLVFFVVMHHLHAQTNTGPMRTPQINQQLYVGQSGYPTIQRTVTSGCGLPGNSYAVIILPGVNPGDTPTAALGCTGVYIEDRRSVPVVYYKWNGTAYVAVTVGASLPSTTNLIAGDGTGQGADSGIAASNVALLNAANTFIQTPQTVTNAGSTTFNVLSTTEGSYPMYVIGGPTATWGLGTGGMSTPFVNDFYIKFLNDNIPVMQLHGANHSWSFWGNGGVGGSLAVNAGGYEIFCTPGYSFCVNNTPPANPNEVYNFTIDPNGNTHAHTLTCDTTPCGTGGGGGGNIADTTNVLQGDGSGNAVAAAMTVDASGNASAASLNLSSNNPPNGGLLTLHDSYPQGYTTVRLAGDVDTWQFSTAGSQTNPSIASNWYVYEEGTQQTWLALQHGNGQLNLFGSALTIGPYGGGAAAATLDNAGNFTMNGTFSGGANHGLQFAPASTYTNFTFNGNNTNGGRLGFVADSSGTDENLYLDTPPNGKFVFRTPNWTATIDPNGVEAIAPGTYNIAASLGTNGNVTATGMVTAANSNATISMGPVVPSTPTALGTESTWNLTSAAGETDYINVVPTPGNAGGFMWLNTLEGNATNPLSPIARLDGAGNFSTYNGTISSNGSSVVSNINGNRVGVIASGLNQVAFPGAWTAWNTVGSNEADFIAIAPNTSTTSSFMWLTGQPGVTLGPQVMFLDASGFLTTGTGTTTGPPGGFQTAQGSIRLGPNPWMSLGWNGLMIGQQVGGGWGSTAEIRTDNTLPATYIDSWGPLWINSARTSPVNIGGNNPLNVDGHIMFGGGTTSGGAQMFLVGSEALFNPSLGQMGGGILFNYGGTGFTRTDFWNNAAVGSAGGFDWFGRNLNAPTPTPDQPLMMLDLNGNLYLRGTVSQNYLSFGAAIQPVPSTTLSARPTTNTGKPSAVVPTTPKQSKQTCRKNSMWHDDDYIYVCVARNEIKRAALASFQ